jgi:hypothetical protein
LRLSEVQRGVYVKLVHVRTLGALLRLCQGAQALLEARPANVRTLK